MSVAVFKAKVVGMAAVAIPSEADIPNLRQTGAFSRCLGPLAVKVFATTLVGKAAR
jgi:hypothetical protein